MLVGSYFLMLSVIAAVLTLGIQRYALAKNILDVPNARSAHTKVTPRGGGVAIVICYSSAILLLGFYAVLDMSFCLLLALAGAVVAGIGWVDDKGHVAARWRLLAHFLAAIVVLIACGGMPSISLWGWLLDLGVFGDVIALLFIVWMLNLFNFMDGIDGIAGAQAAVSCLVVGVILMSVFNQSSAAYLHWLMSACALGFLTMNFPPAKIFMGDAGSGFTGLILAALVLYSAQIDPVLLWVSLIVHGVFVVDATYTLVSRLIGGQKVYQAHSSHCYQKAARKFGSHKKVTLAVIIINLCWLAPLSFAVAHHWLAGAAAMIIAYIPLLAIAYYFKAGRSQVNEREIASC